MDAVDSFVHMGGYAGFVWPAFGLTLLVLGGLLVASVRSLKARQSDLAALRAGTSQRRRREAAREA